MFERCGGTVVGVGGSWSGCVGCWLAARGGMGCSGGVGVGRGGV